MSPRESAGWSPMSSRRVRRNAMGMSNGSSPELSAAAAASPPRSVTLLQASKIVQVPKHERPDGPLSEGRTEDRTTVLKVHDKMFKTYKEPFVQRILRSYDTDHTGMLTGEQLHHAMDRLKLGLTPEEQSRVVAKLAPGGQKVHYMDFLRTFDQPAPLGAGGAVGALPREGIRAAGMSQFHAWNWQRAREKEVPGLTVEVAEGTYEQAQSDAFLRQLVAAKLHQHAQKLRGVFTHLDTDRSSRVGREDFVRAVGKLRIASVPRAQLERLFDLVDTDRSGTVDYNEFLNAFEDSTSHHWSHAANRTRSYTAAPLAQRLALSPDEVAGALNDPLVRELQQNLYLRGTNANSVFRKYDVNRDATLSIVEMTKCCQALAPGITERQVGAVMAALDANNDGYLDYREFVGGLLDGAAPHHRMLQSAPANAQSTGSTATAAQGGLFMPGLGPPPAVPDPIIAPRSLSAVGSLARGAAGDERPGRSLDAGHTGWPRNGARSTVPPPPQTHVSERTNRDAVHDVAVAPFLESLHRCSVGSSPLGATYDASGGGRTARSDHEGAGGAHAMSRSVDLGGLARSHSTGPPAARARGGGFGDGTTLRGEGSHAPSHATGRYSRFWDRRYADTSHVTSAVPDTASYASTQDTFVRKGTGGGSGSFLDYQQDDRVRREQHAAQAKQRFDQAATYNGHYSSLDDASGLDDGKLASKRIQRDRYYERVELYDQSRHSEDQQACSLFGRLNAFNEHHLEQADVFTRH